MIPLTVLHIKGGDENAACVHPPHKARMYMDGLWNLAAYKSQYNRPDALSASVLVKWFGAEQYLFNLVDALSEGRVDHLTYRDFYMDKDGSQFPPSWLTSKSAFKRQVAELCFWDDIERFKNRWVTRRRSGNVPDFRVSHSENGEHELDIVVKLLIGLSSFEPSPIYYTKAMFNTLNNTYTVYTSSMRSFFYRNRYYNFLQNHRDFEEMPNVQRVLSTDQVIQILSTPERRVTDLCLEPVLQGILNERSIQWIMGEPHETI